MNYFRQVFCKHDFAQEEKYCEIDDKNGIKVSQICHRCDYHRKFWKYL